MGSPQAAGVSPLLVISIGSFGSGGMPGNDEVLMRQSSTENMGEDWRL